MTKARDIASAIPAPSTVSSAELGYLDGVTSAIQTQVDAKIAKTLTTTTGDIIYASGANTPARLAIGSTSNVLTVAGGVPTWAAPAGGGKVLQMVTGTTTTATTISSGFADTTLTATITPTLNTSKILVMVSQYVYLAPGSYSICQAYMKLLRGSTDIYVPSDIADSVGSYKFIGSDALMTASFSYVDSPATTSATTYKTQGAVAGGGSPALIFQLESVQSNIILLEIGA